MYIYTNIYIYHLYVHNSYWNLSYATHFSFWREKHDTIKNKCAINCNEEMKSFLKHADDWIYFYFFGPF